MQFLHSKYRVRKILWMPLCLGDAAMAPNITTFPLPGWVLFMLFCSCLCCIWKQEKIRRGLMKTALKRASDVVSLEVLLPYRLHDTCLFLHSQRGLSQICIQWITARSLKYLMLLLRWVSQARNIVFLYFPDLRLKGTFPLCDFVPFERWCYKKIILLEILQTCKGNSYNILSHLRQEWGFQR